MEANFRAHDAGMPRNADTVALEDLSDLVFKPWISHLLKLQRLIRTLQEKTHKVAWTHQYHINSNPKKVQTSASPTVSSTPTPSPQLPPYGSFQILIPWWSSLPPPLTARQHHNLYPNQCLSMVQASTSRRLTLEVFRSCEVSSWTNINPNWEKKARHSIFGSVLVKFVCWH